MNIFYILMFVQFIIELSQAYWMIFSQILFLFPNSTIKLNIKGKMSTIFLLFLIFWNFRGVPEFLVKCNRSQEHGNIQVQRKCKLCEKLDLNKF